MRDYHEQSRRSVADDPIPLASAAFMLTGVLARFEPVHLWTIEYVLDECLGEGWA